MKERISLPITEVIKTVKDYEKLYANNLDNLGEMDKFLGRYKLPKLT